jgi:hypothetical protein
MRRRDAVSMTRAQALQHIVGVFGTIAHEHHVASGIERRVCGLGGGPGLARRLHRQIVAEDHAIEPKPAAQDLRQPHAREAGRPGIDGRIEDVGRHHRGQRQPEPLIRLRIAAKNLVERAGIDRRLDMRIRLHVAVPRKVLAAGCHSGQRQAMCDAFGQQRDDARIRVERAIADRRGHSNRRERIVVP